jgi:transcription elongation factor GreA
MASEKVPMLAEGYRSLEEEAKRLKAERPEIVDAIEEARAHGDLSENAEYHAAKPVRYQLVGQTEADAKAGRISYNSPLGRALIGRQVGDEVEVTTPSGDRYYEIAGIEFV